MQVPSWGKPSPNTGSVVSERNNKETETADAPFGAGTGAFSDFPFSIELARNCHSMYQKLHIFTCKNVFAFPKIGSVINSLRTLSLRATPGIP